jgi:hypothetical protein
VVVHDIPIRTTAQTFWDAMYILSVAVGYGGLQGLFPVDDLPFVQESTLIYIEIPESGVLIRQQSAFGPHHKDRLPD